MADGGEFESDDRRNAILDAGCVRSDVGGTYGRGDLDRAVSSVRNVEGTV